MFKKSKYHPQSEYYRLAYVIKANDNLINFIKKGNSEWEENDEQYFKKPVVIVTEEEQLEGWRPIVKAKVKEAFLRDYAEDYQLEQKIKREEVFNSQELLEKFFDNYFSLEEASDFQILETVAWKP